ncbi:MAG TPA: YraN family protein [Clostridiaceae bacterium]
MSSFNKDIGNLGEIISENFLIDSGYIILDRNFRCKTGEIDLIAKDGDYICFIEVKTRCGSLFGNPCEAVTYPKQQRICKTAQMYILKKKLFKFNFRFDVIEVILNKENGSSSIKLIKNAFDA